MEEIDNQDKIKKPGKHLWPRLHESENPASGARRKAAADFLPRTWRLVWMGMRGHRGRRGVARGCEAQSVAQSWSFFVVGKHPASNSQHPIAKARTSFHWMLDVGCWMFWLRLPHERGRDQIPLAERWLLGTVQFAFSPPVSVVFCPEPKQRL